MLSLHLKKYMIKDRRIVIRGEDKEMNVPKSVGEWVYLLSVVSRISFLSFPPVPFTRTVTESRVLSYEKFKLNIYTKIIETTKGQVTFGIFTRKTKMQVMTLFQRNQIIKIDKEGIIDPLVVSAETE